MSVPNPAELMAIFGANFADDTVFRAVVTSLDGNKAYVRRDGSITPEGSYPHTYGLSLAAGDEVIVAKVGTSYFIICRVVRSGSEAATKTFWIKSTEMQPDGGTWAAANGSQGPYGIQEVNGATQGAFWNFHMPEDAVSTQNPTYTVVYWVSADSGGRNEGVRFEHRYGKLPASGGALTNNVVYTTTADVYVTGRIYRHALTTPTAEPVSANDEVWCNLLRVGNDAADSLIANIIIIGVIIGYEAQ